MAGSIHGTLSVFSQDLVRELRSILAAPSLVFDVREEWASTRENHREKIREALSLALNEDLTDLALPPRPRAHSASISHCRFAGGYAAVSQPTCLGFDLELVARVKPEIIARMSREEEMKNAPSPAHLWTAKEAAFKSLAQNDEVSLMSEITIGAWRRIDGSANLSEIFEFRVSIPQTDRFDGQGVVFTGESVSIALFLKALST